MTNRKLLITLLFCCLWHFAKPDCVLPAAWKYQRIDEDAKIGDKFMIWNKTANPDIKGKIF